MSATNHTRSPDELARVAAAVFEQKVQLSLRPEDNGKFVAIDVGTGEFEVDQDDYTAVKRLRERVPSADVWLARAGYPTAYRIACSR